MSRFYAAVAGATLISALTTASPQAQDDRYVSPWKTPWTYQDQAHWSELDSAYAACGSGKAQSPIDIRQTTPVKLPPLRFEWKPQPLRYVINNRYTWRVNYAPGNGNFLVVGDKRYELVQFHFHHPAEDMVDGRRHSFEMHMMFKSADGAIVGVTVFDVPRHANPVVRDVWAHAPRSEGQWPAGPEAVNLAPLLPGATVRRYDEYMGSVGAPPCTEGVEWFILADPVGVSAEQIAAFAKLWPNDDRETQPLNGRVVRRRR